MSSITLNVADIFPNGTSVAAYPRSNWYGDTRPSGTPLGSSAATATVAADGTLTFSTLTDGTVYFAYAQVGGVDKYRRFMPSTATTSTGGGGSGGSSGVAQPWVASASEQAGQYIAQGGTIYTVPTTRTAAGTFSAASYTLGAPAGSAIIEENALGQPVADWLGMGAGVSALQTGSRLASGVINPRAVYSAGATYNPGDVVLENGFTYLNVATSTGVSPGVNTDSVTGLGTRWYRFAPAGPTGATGPTGSPTTDQSILLRHLSDLARDPTLLTGHIAQAMDRRLPTSNVALTSGTLQLTAMTVPGGRTFNNITMMSGNIGVTGPTHQWFCIYDANRNKIAVTADDTTTAWASSATKTLALTAPYTPSSGALIYVGIVVTATTPNNLSGMGQSNPSGSAPALGGTSTTGLTDPTTAPATGAALVAKAPFWASLS